MTFEEHIAQTGGWVGIWMNWMLIVNAAALLFVIWKVEVRWAIIAMIGNVVLMGWLFDQVGYTRLLGLAHIVFWTPLAIYLWRRLPHVPMNTRFGYGIYLRVLLATVFVSLCFDYVDVARYLLGDHQPMG